MKPPELIDTHRLRLRPPTLEDAEAIFTGYAQDLEVVKYLIWRPHKDIQETKVFLGHCLKNWEAGTNFPYVILRKEDGVLIGMIDAGNDGGVGYVLARPYWGQGYMTEAVKAIVDWSLAQKEISRVWALCDVDNPASARVMEKAGMTFEGRLPGRVLHPNVSSEPRDALSYAIHK